MKKGPYIFCRWRYCAYVEVLVDVEEIDGGSFQGTIIARSNVPSSDNTPGFKLPLSAKFPLHNTVHHFDSKWEILRYETMNDLLVTHWEELL